MKIEKLRKIGQIKRYNASDLICKKGMTTNEMYIILSGKISIHGDEMAINKEIATLAAGDYFGEMGMINDLPLDFTAKGIETVQLLVIPCKNFQKLLKICPDLSVKIIFSIGRRIHFFENKFVKEKKQIPNFDELLLTAVFPQNKKDQDASQNLTLKPENLGTDVFGILPKGHSSYIGLAKETDENFYYKKTVDCPICKNQFSTTIPRQTKLRLKQREVDLREIYHDFEPIWYTIRTCPQCLFSKYHDDFEKMHRLSERGLQQYREHALKLAGKVSLPNSKVLDINTVFIRYYLALFFAELENAPLIKAKLYMSLSWLYQDVGDEQMYDYAWNKAFDYYHHLYYKTNLSGFNPAHEQQLCIILGELHYRKGEIDEALKHFYGAVAANDGINYYTKLARDRYSEVKEERDEKKVI